MSDLICDKCNHNAVCRTEDDHVITDDGGCICLECAEKSDSPQSICTTENFPPSHLCARRILDAILGFQILCPTAKPDHPYIRGLRDGLFAMVEFGLIESFDEKSNLISVKKTE